MECLSSALQGKPDQEMHSTRWLEFYFIRLGCSNRIMQNCCVSLTLMPQEVRGSQSEFLFHAFPPRLTDASSAPLILMTSGCLLQGHFRSLLIRITFQNQELEQEVGKTKLGCKKKISRWQPPDWSPTSLYGITKHIKKQQVTYHIIMSAIFNVSFSPSIDAAGASPKTKINSRQLL